MKGPLKSLLVASLLTYAYIANATPEQDKQTFQRFYTEEFPDVELADFANGVYALHQDARYQWESMSDFPPYEGDLEESEELFNCLKSDFGRHCNA